MAGASATVQQIACGLFIIVLRFLAVKHNWSFPILKN
jgi:hypothetical protein